jgi:hypothetical protein
MVLQYLVLLLKDLTLIIAPILSVETAFPSLFVLDILEFHLTSFMHGFFFSLLGIHCASSVCGFIFF